jgi:hypothetical protein
VATEPWWDRLRATVGRRTSAYQVAEEVAALRRSGGSWLATVVATVARQTPAYRVALGDGASRPMGTVRRRAVDADVADLVRGIARAVVALAAPAELPSFRAVSDDYFARAGLGSVRSGPGYLGFGGGHTAKRRRLTPAILAATTDAVEYLRRDGRSDRRALSELDSAAVDTIVAEAAREAGLGSGEAQRIADALRRVARDQEPS